VIVLLIVVALIYGIDKKIVVLATVVLGVFTQVFSGLGALIAMIPWVGPLIIKVLTIPFFWILNALGYFVSVVAIKKGYSREVINSRTLTIALLTGIMIGYILGHLFPLR
jgi:Na+/proline symporter